MHDKLNYYKILWELSFDGEPIQISFSLVQPVLFDGKKCMLKITSSDEERRGNSLMESWNGDVAPQIFHHDENALLMERATGEKSLTEMAKNGQDDEASRIMCKVIGRIHALKVPHTCDLVPLQIWFRDLKPAANKYGGLFIRSSEIADELLTNPLDQAVLHGDIHHGNVLDFGNKGWLVIDPKGLIGERGFDYANIFCNPDLATVRTPGRLNKQLQIISKEALIEPARLLKWVAAWGGLSAVWSIKDGENAEAAITVAELAISELDNI
ncbi:MAG: aminoglycoside phosphotransferase family protein, partial [Mucilaginibacter sp.]|jgi:streptomycin 6-kinase